jgi:hypothetical protein
MTELKCEIPPFLSSLVRVAFVHHSQYGNCEEQGMKADERSSKRNRSASGARLLSDRGDHIYVSTYRSLFMKI